MSLFGHAQRRDDDNVQNIAHNYSNRRFPSKLRWMDRLKQDMKLNKIRSEWALDTERELVQNDSKRQPNPGSDRKQINVRKTYIIKYSILLTCLTVGITHQSQLRISDESTADKSESVLHYAPHDPN